MYTKYVNKRKHLKYTCKQKRIQIAISMFAKRLQVYDIINNMFLSLEIFIKKRYARFIG